MSELVIRGAECDRCGDAFLFNAARGPAAEACPQCQRESQIGRQVGFGRGDEW